MNNRYKMLEEFLNVHQAGADVYIDGVDMGYIEAVVDFSASLEEKILETGVPISEAGRLPFKFNCELKLKSYQFSPENYVRLLGSSSSYLETWDGSTDYDEYWTDVLADKQLLTFSKYMNSEILAIRTDHKNIHQTDVPVLMNEGGTVTYTEDTDYVVDYANGVIIAVPGKFSDGDKVKVKYKCTPAAGTYLPLKASTLLSAQYAITLLSTDPDTGKYIKVYFPKAEIKPDGAMEMGGEDFWLQSAIVMPVYDPTAAEPLGYLEFEM